MLAQTLKGRCVVVGYRAFCCRVFTAT